MCSSGATCFCCGYATLKEREEAVACPLCGWPNVDQYNALVYVSLPNALNVAQVSLLEAQRNFIKYRSYKQEAEEEEEDIEIPYAIDKDWYRIKDFKDIQRCIDYYVEHKSAMEYWKY